MQAVNFQASNGMFVCAEGGGGREVVANRPVASIWETFALVDRSGGSLNDGDGINIQAYDGSYVCAEGGGGREVLANRRVASIWETFSIKNISRPGLSIKAGDQVALQTYNGHYVCAEGGGGREVVANRGAIGPWETFTIGYLPNQPKRYDTGDKSVGAGKHMQTIVTLQSDGLLITETRTETHVKFAGFHGGCEVCICNNSGNVIAKGPLRLYGVDGQWTGLAWRRVVREEDQFSASVYDEAARFEIFQEICPKNMLLEDIRKTEEIAEAVAEAYKKFKDALG